VREEVKATQEESTTGDADVENITEGVKESGIEPPRFAIRVPDSLEVSIGKGNLKDYVGPPIFTSDRLYDVTPPGVAMGLAWTSMGGAALYVESILETALSPRSRPGFEQTGNLMTVMKESTRIAYSFAKSVMAKDFSENKFFEKAKVHLHCPEGAVQKDGKFCAAFRVRRLESCLLISLLGPSAGITMATSLLSLALSHPLDPTIAMTGELTVTGKVLRIGGLREKTVAARRAGAKTIIFPADNMSDWLELPEVCLLLHGFLVLELLFSNPCPL
jgi:Lon-like ATP-dependent protease